MKVNQQLIDTSGKGNNSSWSSVLPDLTKKQSAIVRTIATVGGGKLENHNRIGRKACMEGI